MFSPPGDRGRAASAPEVGAPYLLPGQRRGRGSNETRRRPPVSWCLGLDMEGNETIPPVYKVIVEGEGL